MTLAHGSIYRWVLRPQAQSKKQAIGYNGIGGGAETGEGGLLGCGKKCRDWKEGARKRTEMGSLGKCLIWEIEITWRPSLHLTIFNLSCLLSYFSSVKNKEFDSNGLLWPVSDQALEWTPPWWWWWGVLLMGQRFTVVVRDGGCAGGLPWAGVCPEVSLDDCASRGECMLPRRLPWLG